MATKSKKFRVLIEGATADGRSVSRQDILDMVETYDPETYNARLNLEHFYGVVPGGPFDMLGSVISLSSQEDEIKIGGKPEKRLAMYAEIEPLPTLIEMNKKGQKVHTSVEIQDNFADTGKASLVGLAVTDNPASLGTNILKFSAQHPDYFASRKKAPGNRFTEAVETEIILIDDETQENPDSAGALAAITGFFKSLTKFDPATQEKPAPKTSGDADPAIAELASGMAQLSEMIGKSLEKISAAQAKTDKATEKTATDLAALTAKLSSEPDKRLTTRPKATGDNRAEEAFY
jgi:Phage capsid scaffolding protein (GPO) serine peptidase